jgi:hypothetical protein
MDNATSGDPVAALVSDLAASEGGKRFLLNLLGGLEAKHLSVDLARRLLGDTADAKSLADPTNAFHPMLEVLRHVIFATPDDYQFQGPSPAAGEGIWMTVKSAEDLASMLRSDPMIPPARLREVLTGLEASGPSLGLPDEAYQRVADAMNDPVSDFNFVVAR